MRRLRFHTASYSYKGADAIDITRLGVDRAVKACKPVPGRVFAPSAHILWPAMIHMDLVAALERRAVALQGTEAGATVALYATELLAKTDAAYEALYREEMRQSYRVHRAQWDDLLGLETAVLKCFCVRRTPGDGQRHTCHRAHLAKYLVACGATDLGEIGGPAHAGDMARNNRIPELASMYAVTGTRPPKPGSPRDHLTIYARICADVTAVIDGLPAGTVVVHGGAEGVDTMAEEAALQRGLMAWEIPSWWDAWGRGAPKVRNCYVAAANVVGAWPSPWGTGTQHAIGLARAAGCSVEVRCWEGPPL